MTPKTHYFAYFAHRAKATALRMHYLGSWQQRIIEHVTRVRSVGEPPASTRSAVPPSAAVAGVGSVEPMLAITDGNQSVVDAVEAQVRGERTSVQSEPFCWSMYAVAKQLGVEKRRVQRNVRHKTRACKKHAAAHSRYVKARRVIQSLKHHKDTQRAKRVEKVAQQRTREGKETRARPGKRKDGGPTRVGSGGKRARGGGEDRLYTKDRLVAEDEGGGSGSKGGKKRWWCEVCGVDIAFTSKSHHINKAKKHAAAVAASQSKPD